MNIVTTSSIVASIAVAIAIAVSFFSLIGAYALIFVGFILHIIMLYRGIQKSAKFPISPFWVYITLTVALNLVLAAFLPGLVMPDMSILMPDMPDFFDIFQFLF